MAGGISNAMVTTESRCETNDQSAVSHRPKNTRTFGETVSRTEVPLTVRDAACFLGVSPQTVYLWVERKQIPHFRVMGRNIRFLISDLRPFRAQFKQEVEDGKTA